ncbi:MAG: hypothetical protein J6Z46_02225 [Lachnospiraceae bacterium]|nr:hypothetical protein [Lachnospiraceae bacterium]
MHKRYLILAVAGLFALAAACGNKGNNDVTPTPEAAVTNAVPEDTGAALPTGSPKATETPVPQEPSPTPEPTRVIRYYDLSEYTYVNTELNGVTETTVDVSGMKTYGVNADFRFTVVFTDGESDVFTAKADNGVLKLDFSKPAAAAEVSVVFKYSLGKDKNTEEDGFIKVPWTVKYDETCDAGFIGNVDTDTKGVKLRSSENYFVAALPDGFYDVTVRKAEQARSTLCINDGAFGVNVGIGGTGRKGSDLTFSAKDIVVSGGEARFSMVGDTVVSYIEFARVSSLVPRKKHIYIAGDSTIQTYYPRENLLRIEPGPGEAQTGWGQVFGYFTTDEVIVDGLGAGGTYARSWYEGYFQGILNNAQAGDYFIIQEGINDRTYSSTEEMEEYLRLMITKCREIGVIPVLVTSQQTAKFWKSADGREIGEFDKPEGSGLNAFMVTIRNLAKETGTFLIDNAELTAEWYQKVGRTYVEQTYHIYDFANDKSVDSLHSSYRGSEKIAELIATDIATKISENATDAYGNTLSGIKLHPVVTYEMQHVNALGETVTETVTAVDHEDPFAHLKNN